MPFLIEPQFLLAKGKLVCLRGQAGRDRAKYNQKTGNFTLFFIFTNRSL
jgi:hypothetical protein